MEKVKTIDGAFYAVGVTFEGRQTLLQELLDEYQRIGKQREIKLEFEPTNKFDPNAIKVLADIPTQGFQHIGYVPKETTSHFKAINDNIVKIGIKSIGKSGANTIGVKIFFEVNDD